MSNGLTDAHDRGSRSSRQESIAISADRHRTTEQEPLLDLTHLQVALPVQLRISVNFPKIVAVNLETVDYLV